MKFFLGLVNGKTVNCWLKKKPALAFLKQDSSHQVQEIEVAVNRENMRRLMAGEQIPAKSSEQGSEVFYEIHHDNAVA